MAKNPFPMKPAGPKAVPAVPQKSGKGKAPVSAPLPKGKGAAVTGAPKGGKANLSRGC